MLTPRLSYSRSMLTSLLIATLGTTACNDSAFSPTADTTPTVPTRPITLDATEGCAIDSDCASGTFCFQNQCVMECDADASCAEGARCTDRGRCVDAKKQDARDAQQPDDRPALDDEGIAVTPSTFGTIGVAQWPASVLDIEEGQESVTVTLVTDAPLPGGRLPYRVELEGETVEGVLHHAEGSTRFDIVLPTGVASLRPEDDRPRIQFAYVVTGVGGFSVTMRPAVRDSGDYTGEVIMREFGSGGLPLHFALRLTPADASLESATTRELLLPVSATELFSPRYSSSATIEEWQARPLEYDPASKRWFARIASPFAMPMQGLFGQNQAIVRTLRIEIERIEAGVVYGALTDRWEGLFAERSADGVTSQASVRLSGAFQASRVGALPASTRSAVAGLATLPTPTVDTHTNLGACSGPTWQRLYANVNAEWGGEDSPCFPFGRTDEFYIAHSVERAECALSVADHVLSGPTTAKQIQAFLDPQQENPEGLSFQDFLSRCAAQDGYCVPNPDILCAAELTALAYQAYDYQDADSPQEAASSVARLLDSFQSLSRESYLGRQLAAYQRDTQTRLDWLRASIAPLFLAAELRTYNQDMLQRWDREVLQTHYAVMAMQYAPASLEVLARVPNDMASQASRRSLLLELTQSWQATMDALQLAASRWNVVHQNDTKRAASAAAIQARTLELYLSAASLAYLNRSAGSAGFNTQFGSGFSSLARNVEQLRLPFSDLLFLRDTEVVLSRSVDPNSNSNTLLREMEQVARQSVRDAQDTVDRVIADAHNDELTQALLRDRMQTQQDTLRSDLAGMCGIRVGCRLSDIGTTAGCDVPTAIGECGFAVGKNGKLPAKIVPADVAPSEAGTALLDLERTAIEWASTQEEYRAQAERIRILSENARAFEENLRAWDTRRRTVHREIDTILRDIQGLHSTRLREIAGTLTRVQALRTQAYNAQSASVAKWAEIAFEGAVDGYDDARSINHKRMNAMYLSTSADFAADVAESLAEGIGDDITSIKAMNWWKSGILLAGSGVKFTLSMIAVDQEHRANQLEAQMEYEQAMRDAQVTQLRGLADLNAQLTENNIAKIADDLRLLDLTTNAEILARESLIDSLTRSLAADLAYEADLQQLRDRQRDIHMKKTELPALAIQITRAEMALDRQRTAYQAITQRAQLLEGRFLALQARTQNLEQLMGSPSVIFAFANRLASAEARLERAKTLLFDWLVALEYYAVRPFPDQRMAIMLARNPSQLEAIANDLQRLQRVCGGIVNYETVDVSVRDHLLRMNHDVVVPTPNGEGLILSPADRFLALLRRGNIPVNTQTRYTSDSRIGDLIANRSVMALTFPIRLTDFANLPQSCNAKIASVAVQLVGQHLDGAPLPTVSVLYDGTSELLSCQPNIDTLVAALDPGATKFGRVTRFRTQGRSVTPVARVNAYGPIGTENRGLEGLPLSSTYTLLIDPAMGDNRHIDWSRLEDIRLQFTYAYQDVFPTGQCQ